MLGIIDRSYFIKVPSMDDVIVGVTGHRPPKLGGYSPEARTKLTRFAARWLTSRAAPDQVITGMALGWDTAVAQACDAMGIPFIAAVPFEGQESRWQDDQQAEYRRLLDKAVKIAYISPGPYAPELMHIRNEWMVDNSTEMAALWDGSMDGGTAHCVSYIKRVVKPWVNLWPEWTAFSPRGSLKPLD